MYDWIWIYEFSFVIEEKCAIENGGSSIMDKRLTGCSENHQPWRRQLFNIFQLINYLPWVTAPIWISSVYLITYNHICFPVIESFTRDLLENCFGHTNMVAWLLETIGFTNCHGFLRYPSLAPNKVLHVGPVEKLHCWNKIQCIMHINFYSSNHSLFSPTDGRRGGSHGRGGSYRRGKSFMRAPL